MRRGILKVDVFSHFKTGKNFNKYGSKGEAIKIVTDHVNVIIVESTTGDRYPVKKELVIITD